MSTTPPWFVSGPMCCTFNARTAERNTRLRCSGSAQNHSHSNAVEINARGISTPRGRRWHKVGDLRGGAGVAYQEAWQSVRLTRYLNARYAFGVIVMQRSAA